MADGHGGARQGGGRPLGSKNSATAEREDAINSAIDSGPEGETAVDAMIRVMRNVKVPLSIRVDCMKTVAQYQSSKLSTVTVHEKVSADRAQIKDGLVGMSAATLQKIALRGLEPAKIGRPRKDAVARLAADCDLSDKGTDA